jgi:hypothetical protein
MQQSHSRSQSEDIQWLSENDFGEYQDNFTKHQITGDLLPDLNYATLKDIGVLIVGDRARIMQAIKKLQPKPLSKGYSRPAKGYTSSDQEIDYGRKKSTDSHSNNSTPNTTPKMQRKPMVSFQSVSRDTVTTIPLRDNSGKLSNSYQKPYRNQQFRSQRGGAMKPLVIFPRSSSIKDSGTTKSTQQDLSDAFDSVFGSASQTNSPNPPSANVYTSPVSLPTAASADSPSPNDQRFQRPEKDIMNMKSVREVFYFD